MNNGCILLVLSHEPPTFSKCDVKESWDADEHPTKQIAELVKEVLETKADFVVITGGEPAMYNLDPITRALQENGIETAIETSGAHELSGNWHWVCLSPKRFKQPQPSVYEFAHELKIIVYNRNDLKWAEMHAGKVNQNCKLFLQPEWGRQNEMMPLIINHVKDNPKWRISLQTHKYLNIP